MINSWCTRRILSPWVTWDGVELIGASDVDETECKKSSCLGVHDQNPSLFSGKGRRTHFSRCTNSVIFSSSALKKIHTSFPSLPLPIPGRAVTLSPPTPRNLLISRV